MRQFVSNLMPDKHGEIKITGKQYKYFTCVLRLKRKDTVDVRLPDGSLYCMSAEKITADALILKKVSTTCEKTRNATIIQGVNAFSLDTMSNKTQIWLYQFVTKPQKMDLIVRQATECGVSRIIPIAGDYSCKSDCSQRLDRWNRIIVEARQQSGSPVSTIIEPVVCLTEALSEWENIKTEEKLGYLLHESPEYGRMDMTKFSDKVKYAALVVGCEGGMSQDEVTCLIEKGFTPIHFMTNVLRAETAALYGTAILQQCIALKE